MSHSAEYRRILDKMSFYSDQEGLYRRYLNEEANWKDHIAGCHNFILKSLSIAAPSRIIVLGSGLVVEFPLEEVLKSVGSVTLIDIVHPPYIKELAQKDRRVILEETDITGGMIREVWNFSRLRTKGRSLPSLLSVIKDYDLPADNDTLIVSLNILSQLDTLLTDYLVKKRVASEDELILFRKRIQESHLSMLNRFNNVLITDFRETVSEKGRPPIVNDLVLVPLPSGVESDQWVWHFDNSGNYNSRGLTRFDVLATLSLRESKR